MYRVTQMQYEHSDRVRGLASGGIGAMHRLAQHTGLVDAIDRHVEVLKVALPYHESDHVLGIAYNVLCGGTCLQDIELRRQDEVYLDALGTRGSSASRFAATRTSRRHSTWIGGTARGCGSSSGTTPAWG